MMVTQMVNKARWTIKWPSGSQQALWITGNMRPYVVAPSQVLPSPSTLSRMEAAKVSSSVFFNWIRKLRSPSVPNRLLIISISFSLVISSIVRANRQIFDLCNSHWKWFLTLTRVQIYQTILFQRETNSKSLLPYMNKMQLTLPVTSGKSFH